MQKLMTADQAFNVSMNLYPSLYTSDTLENAKFKYGDHIFNVIGNGYRDHEEFIEGHTINKSNKHLIDSFPEKYITGNLLYSGYTKVKKIGDYEHADYESRVSELLTKEELDNRTDIVYSVKVRSKGEKKVPYPNFQKEYSLVWRVDLEQIDNSWKLAAIDYYNEAKKFFNSEDVNLYHSAVPKNEDKLKILIESYEENFSRKKKEGMSQEEYYELITKDYKTEYNGNTLDFIQRSWEKEKNRIFTYIEETLDYLENSLTNNHNLKKAKKM